MSHMTEAQIREHLERDVTIFFDKAHAQVVELIRNTEMTSIEFPVALTVVITTPDPGVGPRNMMIVGHAADETGYLTARGSAICATRDLLLVLANLASDTNQPLDLMAAINSHPMLNATPQPGRTVVDLVEDKATGGESTGGRKDVH